MKDIVKGIIYNRGEAELNGVKKHLSLVALIIASDKPIVNKENNETIIMGSAEIIEQLETLTKYKCPYVLGDLTSGVVSVSDMKPDDLEEL